MKEGQQVQIGPDQVVRAAKAGLQLLNTPGAIKADGPMSISGDLQLLNAVLTAIAQGQVVLGHPEKVSSEGPVLDEFPANNED